MKYISDMGELSLILPDDWDIYEPPDGLLMLAISPEEKISTEFDAQITLSHEQIESETSAEEYLLGNLIPLITELNNFKQIGSGSFDIKGGKICVAVVLSRSFRC